MTDRLSNLLILQAERMARLQLLQELFAHHKDSLRPAAAAAAKRRSQRNNAVKAWHSE